MAIQQLSGFLHSFRRITLRDEAGQTDAELLNAFVRQRDESALAALVERHGPMVWRVCRRLLRSLHDAEDVFQATFLVLVRKAATIRDKETVANWLYGVARQTAVRVRVLLAKQHSGEQVKELPEPDAPAADLWDDLPLLLDKELSLLPDKYRAVLVLCELEGKTRRDAAWQLGCPEGTVAGRLARARELLAKRMARHGLALPAGALAVALTQNAAASVPVSVASSTIKTASLFAAGQGAAGGLISARVATLTKGVLKTMLLTKLKTVMMVLLVVGMAGLGGGILLHSRASGQQPDCPTAEPGTVHAAEVKDPALARVNAPAVVGDRKTAALKAHALSLDKALQMIQEAEAPPHEKINMLTRIARIQSGAGDNRAALKTLGLAGKLVKEVERGVKGAAWARYFKAFALAAIADGQARAGDVPAARKALDAVAKLAEDQTDKNVVYATARARNVILQALANAAARSGDFAAALKDAAEIDESPYQILVLWSIARRQAERKDIAGAVATIRKTESLRIAEMLMDVAALQEKADRKGAAKTWRLAAEALPRMEINSLDLRDSQLSRLLPLLVARGHGEAVQRWIDGLAALDVKVELLLILAGKQ